MKNKLVKRCIYRRLCGRSISNQRGITLVEMIVAMSLLSIVIGMAFSFYLFAHKQIIKREKKAFAFESSYSLLRSIATNIRKSKETVFLDEQQWLFLRYNGDTAMYSFEEGQLIFNKTPLLVSDKPIAFFSFTCFGRDTVLDLNNDRIVDFDEVDLNSDQRIDEDETKKISRIKVTLNMKENEYYEISAEECVK